MDRRQQLVALLLLAFSGFVQAGYALVSPPSSFSTVAGVMQYQAAANDVSVTNAVRGAAGSVNVGGRAITMPAAYRFAANAGTTAARYAFGNPALFVAVAAGSALYAWYHDSGFDVAGGAWVKPDPSVCAVAPCYVYQMQIEGKYASGWSASVLQSCQSAGSNFNSTTTTSYGVRNVRSSGQGTSAQCIFDLYFFSNGSTFISNGTSGGSVDTTAPSVGSPIPVGQSEFEAALSSKPIPAGLPQLLPIPLPVEKPVLNPSPDPVPLPRPMRVPMGDPQPVPNSSPPKWKTPVVDIVPSPDTPWQVDLQPKDIIKEDATPLPASDPVPATPPAGQTDEPVTPDLCEKNPDILACQKINLGTLEPAVVVHTDKSTSINKDAGWGPDNGICPAPRSVQLIGGTSVSFPFDLLCQFASGIRPIVIALAWLAAALAFIGFARRD